MTSFDWAVVLMLALVMHWTWSITHHCTVCLKLSLFCHPWQLCPVQTNRLNTETGSGGCERRGEPWADHTADTGALSSDNIIWRPPQPQPTYCTLEEICIPRHENRMYDPWRHLWRRLKIFGNLYQSLLDNVRKIWQLPPKRSVNRTRSISTAS